MLCGKPGCDVHEIACGRGVRQHSVKTPATWLYLCRPCHDEMQRPAIWPIELQLIVKLLKDPDNHNPKEVARCMGWRPDAFSADRILQKLRSALVSKKSP